MAVTTMELMELLRKVDGGDIDFLREGVGVLAQALMDAEVSAQIGAEHGQRTPTRATHRNGYRARDWDTRVGTIDLQIPRVREGSYLPSFLEPRRRAERALAAVVAQCYVEGVSTRRVEDIAQAMASPACRSPRSPGSAPSSTSSWQRGATGRWTPARTCSYGWMRWSSRSARRGRVVNTAALVAPVSTPTGTARSSAWSWAPPRTVPPGRASCGGWSPAACPGSSWWSLTPLKG
jgi:hypothetical protein